MAKLICLLCKPKKGKKTTKPLMFFKTNKEFEKHLVSRHHLLGSKHG